MKVGFVYANSWEYAYPQYASEFDRNVWCGTDDFVAKYPRAVSEHGVETVFFYLSASATTQAEFTHKYGFRLRRIPVRFGSGNAEREMSWKLLTEAAREECDLLHFYNYYHCRRYPDMFDLFAFYCRARRIPFVTHYQVGEFPHADPRSRLKQALLQPRRIVKRLSLGFAARILSLNRLEIRRLTDPAHPGYYGFPFPREKCVHIPNIVDPALFFPVNRESACRDAGLDPVFRYIVYVGFFREAKGIQHLVDALARLQQDHPDAKLLLVGDGTHEQDLRSQVCRLNLTEKVLFVGPVSHDRLRLYYGAADVHVLPSYTESFGNVLIEALACNTPSIGSAVGGIPEVLSNGIGLLVPPRDEKALSEAVHTVLGGGFTVDSDKRSTKLREYSYETSGKILHETYHRIIHPAGEEGVE